MKVAIYLRVSTSKQSTDLQRRDLLEYVERRGWTLTETYEDSGISGATRSRPALDKLLAAAHRHEFNAVLVWKLDRLGRSVSHLSQTLDLLKDLGVQFISFSDGIDTSTAAGKLVFNILASVAEMERELIKERVSAGVRNAVASGKRMGRPRVNVSQTDVLRMLDSGLSTRAIGKEYGISSATVSRLARA
jgi:DNA invertase Pin-like site-specific DNA recombinase